MIENVRSLSKVLGQINTSSNKNEAFKAYLKSIELLFNPHFVLLFNHYPINKQIDLPYQIYSTSIKLRSILTHVLEENVPREYESYFKHKNASFTKNLLDKLQHDYPAECGQLYFVKSTVRFPEKEALILVAKQREEASLEAEMPELLHLLSTTLQLKHESLSRHFWDFDAFSREHEDSLLFCELTPYGKIMDAKASFYQATGLEQKSYPHSHIKHLFAAKDHISIQWLIKSITPNSPFKIINLPTFFHKKEGRNFQWFFLGEFDEDQNLERIKACGVDFSEEIVNAQKQEALAEDAILLSEQLSMHQEELKVSMEELQQANNMLTIRENHLSALINSTLIGIISIDKYGNIFETNAAAEKILEMDKYHFKHNFSHYFHTKSRNSIIDFLQMHIGFKNPGPDSIRFQERLNLPEQHNRFIDCAINKVENAGKIAFVATMLDITDIKESEEELEKSHKLYRMLAESTSDVILLLSPHLHIQYISPSCKKQLGYTPNELKEVGYFNMVHTDDLDEIKMFRTSKTVLLNNLFLRPIENTFPKLLTNTNNRYVVSNLGLHQTNIFKQLIKRAKTTRIDNQSTTLDSQSETTNKHELKTVLMREKLTINTLLALKQRLLKTNRRGANLGSTAISSKHDARTATRTNSETILSKTFSKFKGMLEILLIL